MTEDETVGWDHRLNGHEFEQTPVSEGQGSPLVPFSGVLLFRAYWSCPRACLKEQRQGMEARSMQVTQIAKMSMSEIARPSPHAAPSGASDQYTRS